MNELREILDAIDRNGISDERLAELREYWKILGLVLDSAQSDDGLTRDCYRQGRAYLDSLADQKPS